MVLIDLITLSREYGAGASDLAALLGARLGWRVLDQDIAPAVARRLGLSDDAVVAWDEHAPSWLERVGQSLIMGSPDLLVNPDVARQPNAADVAQATRALLSEAAAKPPLIIVGHGGQALFRGRAGALHLRLVAPLEARVKAVVARRGGDAQGAAALAQRMDADRANYVRTFFGCDVRDPLLYHLQINTGLVAMDEAVGIVAGLVEQREGGGRVVPRSVGTLPTPERTNP